MRSDEADGVLTGPDSMNFYTVKVPARLVKKAAPYNMSHMDFCNAISVENLYTVGEVIRGSTGLSYHMVTVMRGRECGPRHNDIIVPNLHRGERRKIKKEIQKNEQCRNRKRLHRNNRRK